MPNPLLDAALEYRRRGFSVIPVAAGSKRPMVAWGDYQTRLPTVEEIKTWWARDPRANVGIVTGAVSNLIVVDVESRNVNAAKEIYDRHPTPYVQKTGGGGYHLFYACPPDGTRIPNSVNREMGVDIRGEGGFVVVAPSSHQSGKKYEWTNWPSSRKVRPNSIDPSIIAAFMTRSAHKIADRGEDDHWLARVLAGVGSGERDNTAARLAGYYFSKKIPEDVTMAHLLDWNQKNSPPLTEKDIRRIVASVYKTANRRGSTNPSMPVSVHEGDAEAFALMPLSKYMAQFGSVDVPWCVEDWLPDRTIAMVVAPPGSFKTWMLTDLALSVASGKPFLGTFPVVRKGPVIIVQQEDFHGQMAERIGVVALSKLGHRTPTFSGGVLDVEVPAEVPVYLHPDRRLRFDDKVVVDALAEAVAQIRPALVIIDPLYTTGKLDDFMAEAVENMMVLKSLRDEFGCSFLLAHHTKKKSEGSDREDAWGTQFLNAFLETGWQVRVKPDTPATVKVRRHFKTRSNIEEQSLEFRINTVNLPYSYEAVMISKEEEEAREKAQEPEEKADKPGRTNRSAREALERAARKFNLDGLGKPLE